MATQLQPLLSKKEGRISLAASALQNNQVCSERKAVQLSPVSRSTLRIRLAGVQSKSASPLRQRKLLPIEGQSFVQWILHLDRRGFPSQSSNPPLQGTCRISASRPCAGKP
jgi:hypothetical protein